MKILDIPRSGSYAGVTSSHNRAGQYVRNRRTPTNTPTARRTAIRTAFGAGSSGYSSITDAQRAAWAAAADAHPITDRLGSSITLTGHQLYVAVNTQLVNCGASSVAVPPSSFAVFSVSGTTAVFSVASGFTLTPVTTGGATDHMLIAFTKPTSAGRSFPPAFSQYARLAGNAITEEVTTAVYAAIFGAPVIGQKVFVKVTPVSVAGVTGTALVIPMICTT